MTAHGDGEARGSDELEEVDEATELDVESDSEEFDREVSFYI